MRGAHIVLVAAVGVVLALAGCSGKPNDLRHYRERVPGPESPASRSGAPAPTTVTTPMSSAAAELTGMRRRAQRALLDQQDLAEEGVRLAGAPEEVVLRAMPTCGAPLDTPAAALAGYRAGWQYDSGATLGQYVADYPDTPASRVADAARRALDCGSYPGPDGTHRLSGPVESTPLPGVDARLMWCERGPTQAVTCTVVLARGELLTSVQVSAATEARAQAAIGRLTPLAAAALQRD